MHESLVSITTLYRIADYGVQVVTTKVYTLIHQGVQDNFTE